MPHKAETILEAVETLLTGLTTTGANVERARVHPWTNAELPAISLFMGADTPLDNDARGIGFYDWGLLINVDAVCKKTATSGIDTTLNLIRAELTTALVGDYTLGLSFVIDIVEQGSSEPEISGEGEKPIALQRTTFLIKYRRSIGDPRL